MNGPQLTPTVFIVDDEEYVRESTAMIVSSLGVRTECFTSGEDFLQHFNYDKPSCVILDFKMPGLSGEDVQYALRVRSIHPPIIFVTGCSDISFAAKATRDGAFDFFSKPFAPEPFLRRVSEALQVDEVMRRKRSAVAEVRDLVTHLTPRERQIAALLALGESCKQISHRLAISHKTVENHRTTILEKMGVDNPTQLSLLLAKDDLISGLQQPGQAH